MVVAKFLRDAWFITKKDLWLEFKFKQMIIMMVVFSALTILAFGFSFDSTQKTLKAVIPGMIWIITIFTGIIGLNRSFTLEKENDSFTGLQIAPIDSTSIYFGKVLANYVIVSIVQLVSIPLLFILLDVRYAQNTLSLLLIIPLGTLGFIVLGTFLAALASNGKNSEVLLPVLLFPLISPLLVGAVQATSGVLNGGVLHDVLSWLQLIAVFDLVYCAACFFLFEYIVEG